MDFTTVDMLKTQCRIALDCTDEDALLEAYLDSAEATVCNYIGRDYTEMLDYYGETPRPLVLAALLIASDSYAYREAGRVSGVGGIGAGISHLLNPYRRLS